jgi:hypothetical protein
MSQAAESLFSHCNQITALKLLEYKARGIPANSSFLSKYKKENLFHALQRVAVVIEVFFSNSSLH